MGLLVLIALTVYHYYDYRKDASLRRQMKEQREQTRCGSVSGDAFDDDAITVATSVTEPDDDDASTVATSTADTDSSAAFSSSNLLQLQQTTNLFQHMDSFMSKRHHEYLHMWDSSTDTDSAPASQMAPRDSPATGTVHVEWGDADYLRVSSD